MSRGQARPGCGWSRQECAIQTLSSTTSGIPFPCRPCSAMKERASSTRSVPASRASARATRSCSAWPPAGCVSTVRAVTRHSARVCGRSISARGAWTAVQRSRMRTASPWDLTSSDSRRSRTIATWWNAASSKSRTQRHLSSSARSGVGSRPVRARFLMCSSPGQEAVSWCSVRARSACRACLQR